MKISILIGSKTPLPGAATVPDELAPVVKQLESTLRYPHYGLLTATVQRTKPVVQRSRLPPRLEDSRSPALGTPLGARADFQTL